MVNDTPRALFTERIRDKALCTNPSPGIRKNAPHLFALLLFSKASPAGDGEHVYLQVLNPFPTTSLASETTMKAFGWFSVCQR